MTRPKTMYVHIQSRAPIIAVQVAATQKRKEEAAKLKAAQAKVAAGQKVGK